MKIIYWLLGIIILVPVVFLALMFGASEFSGEVVTLERSEAEGGVSHIRVWIVDDGDASWIEHGDSDSFWMSQLSKIPTLTIERDGQSIQYNAVADPDAHQLYHRLRREKYGVGDQIVAMLGGGALPSCESMPVRLQVAR